VGYEMQTAANGYATSESFLSEVAFEGDFRKKKLSDVS